MAIFDESKKTKSSGVMSSDKRKIQKVDALLRQRQKELITSLDAETEKIRNSNSQSLNTSINLLERPLVVIIITTAKFIVSKRVSWFTWNLCNDEFSGTRRCCELPQINWWPPRLSFPPLPSAWHFHLPFSYVLRRMWCSATTTTRFMDYSIRTDIEMGLYIKKNGQLSY